MRELTKEEIIDKLQLMAPAFEDLTMGFSPKMYAGLLASLILDYSESNGYNPKSITKMILKTIPEIKGLGK